MVRSMIAGVAGLKTHQAKMDIIGNNIANVNTWGFKSSSVNFADSMYATSINGTGGTVTGGGYGGRNASQVGYGVTTSSITSEFGTGSPSPSANSLDCMIDGTGFFLVGSMVNGSFTNVADSGLYLSRVGIFRPDNNGYLVDDQRSYVYGYALVDGTGIPETPATAGEYTVTRADATFGMTANGSGRYEVTIAGITIESIHSDPEDQIQDWIAEVAGQQTYQPAGGGAEVASPFADYNVQYNNYQVTDTVTGDGTINLTITKKTTGDDSANTLSGNFTFARAQAAEAAGSTAAYGFVTVNVGNDRVAGVDAEYSTQLSALRIPTDPNTGAQYEIQSYTIYEDGSIIGVDINNRTIAIGQIALISVENPNGLEKDSGYYYTIGPNAGNVEAVTAGGGPVGSIMGGYLEMANVDLANEFSQMITTQRGFQANSKIITVTDEMLQELVNMKR